MLTNFQITSAKPAEKMYRLADAGEGKLQLAALVILGPPVTAALISAVIMALETRRSPGALVRMTQWFGILTYAVYVVHAPVYNGVRAWAPSAIEAPQSLTFTIVAIVTSILIAAAAYLFVERPFDVLKVRRQ